MVEHIKTDLDLLWKECFDSELGFTIEQMDFISSRINEIKRTIVSRVELPVKPEIADDSNKIKWFMELAIKMYDTGYCDASIYSIDTDAWDEYRVNDKLTPSQAIAEEESNG